MAIMQGDLAEYPVPDLLQFIHASRKQGQLILESSALARPAGVFFSGGELVHAYCPPVIGVPALYQLLAWQQGRFAFLKGAAAPERTIHDDLQSLILEGLRRLDEFRVLEAHLPPFDTALHLALDQAASDEIRLTHPEWRLLSQVDGRRTLRVLQEALGCDRHALAEELRLLVRTGWVRIAAGAEPWRRHLSG